MTVWFASRIAACVSEFGVKLLIKSRCPTRLEGELYLIAAFGGVTKAPVAVCILYSVQWTREKCLDLTNG